MIRNLDWNILIIQDIKLFKIEFNLCRICDLFLLFGIKIDFYVSI